MIVAYEHLALINEPNWEEYAALFDESGFEIYSTRELVEVNDESRVISRDLQAKLNTSKALDQIRSRYFELSEFVSQLESEDEKERLLERWEKELAQHSRALIGWSLDEWVKREEHVILF